MEVHHIVQKADGGANDLDNAIVLCFDCHCSAGHYNSRHPRGTKFRPSELRKHRDTWHKAVEEAGIKPLDTEEFSEYYARHLICLDPEAARDLLQAQKERIPFRYDFLMENDVLRFMTEVLGDDLPFSSARTSNFEGNYWGDGTYDTLEEFHHQHPEFKNQNHRPLTSEDFSEDGLVPSKMFRKLVDEGFAPSNLGEACVEGPGCGGIEYYVSVRRPLFVFAELRNTSDQPIRLSGLILRKSEKEPFFQEFKNWDDGEITTLEYGNLELAPGEVLLISECILLGSKDHDPVETDHYESLDLGGPQAQIIGFHNSTNDDDFYWFGPTLKLEGFDLEVGRDLKSVSIHRFNPSKCYVYYRAWMCGSCPHLYAFNTRIGWGYLGELLSSTVDDTSITETIPIPDGTSKIRIVETDFEESHIETLEFNHRSLIERPVRLRRGDSIEFNVSGAGALKVEGRYIARIMAPQHYLHIRQNISLRTAYERTYLR